MKTFKMKPTDIKKEWFTIDASGKEVGRLASQIAYLLMGKHKPLYVPFLDCGDNIVVIHADKVVFTGNKWQKKFYYHHTGYIGGIKSVSAEELLTKNSERIIEQAVKGMLPRNKMGRKILKNLKIYKGGEHPHQSQKPSAAPERLCR